MQVSCKKIEKYSEIPEIEFKSYTLSDHLLYDPSALGFPYVLGTLTFEFKDGDGDFGEILVDNAKIDTNNLFMSFFEKIDGEFYLVTEYDTLFDRPIEYDERMAREGQNKLLKGEIEVYDQFIPNNFPHDTFLFEFYIIDRARNKSNVERTNEIVLDWDNYL